MARYVNNQLTETHRAVLAPVIIDMVPAGAFLNFVAAGRFQGCNSCRRKMQELRREVLDGISDICLFGIGLPPFLVRVRPAVIAFDPMLQPGALRRYQRLWHIDGPISCLCCASECQTLDPIQVLRYENRSPQSLFLKDNIDFLAQKCCLVELACWESTFSIALPWPLMQQYPSLPCKDDMVVDYTIIYLQRKTVGLAMCFWRVSPLPWRLAFAPTPNRRPDDSEYSTDSEDTESLYEGT